MPTHDVWGRYDDPPAEEPTAEDQQASQPGPREGAPAGSGATSPIPGGAPLHRLIRRRDPELPRPGLTGDPAWDAVLAPVGLTVMALVSLGISVFLFVDLVTGRQAVFQGWGIVAAGLTAVGLAYFPLVAGLCQLPTAGPRRQISAPRLAILLGGLAVVASLALPLVEPAVGRRLYANDRPPSCHDNIRRLWTLVGRYRADTGHYPPGGPDFLRPVWDRYHEQEAEAFFCPQSYEYLRIQDEGGDLASAPFEEISYEGGLVSPETPRIPEDIVGPPLIWEKSLWHGPRTVQMYTHQLGVHSNTPQVLRMQIERYRTEQNPPPPTARR